MSPDRDDSPASLEVRHNSQRHRFYIPLDDGEAHLDYERIDSQTVDYAHTFVSEELRGRGLAAHLVQQSLEHARDQGWKVIPSCPYVASYLKEHPEYQDLRA